MSLKLPSTGEAAGYRRGVILGLSMAEALLILIFVLLMIFSTIIVKYENDAKATLERIGKLAEPEDNGKPNWDRIIWSAVAIESLIKMGYSEQQLRDVLAAIPSWGKPPELSKNWTKITWVAGQVGKLEQIDLIKLFADPELLTAVQRLLDMHYTSAELRGFLQVLPQFGKPSDKDWTKIAKAAGEIARLEGEGVDVSALFANEKTILAIQQLISKGYTQEQLRDMLGAIQQLIGSGYNAEELRNMLSAMPLFGKPADLPADWKQVADAATAVRKLEKAGINVDALVDDPRTVVVIQQLVAKGYTQEKLRDMLAAIALFGKPNELPKDWSRVAHAADSVGKLEKAGVNVDKLIENISAVSALQRLIDKGYTADQIRDMLAPKPPPVPPPPSSSLASRWPPMIPLSEAGGYHFATYSADLTDDFRTKLHDGIAPMIDRLMRQYDVDVVEVIGNTDERPVNGSDRNPVNGSDGNPINGSNKNPVISNLDTMLLPVLRGNRLVRELKSADNTDLGMARAVAVTKELRALLPGRNIIPLSAAQLIGLSGELSDGTQPGDVEVRRRIEIRLRHSDAGP